MVNILYTPRFRRAYKKLDDKIKQTAVEKIKLFEQDPFDPRLKTHKLTAHFAGNLAFSVGHDMRIMFRFAKTDNGLVYFETIGDHSIYKKI